MQRASRLPPPLPCAVIIATAIALTGSPSPTRPPGTNPDDRIDDAISGTIGAPILMTPHGHGAPLHTETTTVWLWTDAAIAPCQQVRAVGRLVADVPVKRCSSRRDNANPRQPRRLEPAPF